jgi:spermidine synthase
MEDSRQRTLNGSFPVSREIQLSAVSLGITSLVAQIILLREFLSIFYGNELVIGIILTHWMILTGIGAFAGRLFERLKQKIKTILLLTLSLGILPLLTVFCLRWLRNIVFIPGEMIDISRIAYTSFALLSPYCILGGALFTLLVHTSSSQNESNTISRIYSLEAIGSVIGGLTFTFIMLYFFSTFQCLKYLLLFNLAVAYLFSIRYKYAVLKYCIIAFFFLAILFFSFFDLDTLTRNKLFNGQTILSHNDTPYGQITVTGQERQKNFFENNVLLFSTDDVVSNEEAVHYAMIQHPQPKSILLISGAIAGITQEVLKYDPVRIDYVDINPWLIETEKRFTSVPHDSRIHVVSGDPRRYVKKTAGRYDVALLNVSDPVNIALNRYYTIEFFRELKSKLNSGAVVSIGFLENVDYYGEKARMLNSVLRNTLAQCFANVLIIPGTSKNYFLASDSFLDIHIANKMRQRKIATDFVNQYYLDDGLLLERSQSMKKGLIQEAALNEDFRPIAYYRHVAYWLSYFKTNYWIIPSLLVIILLPVMREMNAINFGMLTGGFTASSSEVILLLAFQVICGYAYQASGLIMTIFMAGLAVGSLYRKKIFPENSMIAYTKVQFIAGIFVTMLPFILTILRDGDAAQAVVQVIFVLLTLVISVLIGIQFSLASSIRTATNVSTTSSIYSYDLIGSALGAAVASIFLIPLFGVANACIITAGVCLTGCLVSFWKKKAYRISLDRR